ncbi:hypothetical protein LRP88_11073 [Fusarium phalaenopsidis]
MCDNEVYETYDKKGITYQDPAWMEELLGQAQGYRVLVYVGNKDWYSNAAGQRELADHLRWQHQPTFKSLDVKPLKMNGRKIRLKKDFKHLDFVDIYDAGHLVCGGLVHDKLLVRWQNQVYVEVGSNTVAN